MLRLLDIFLTVVHLAVIIFNLFAWIPKSTRRANFVLIVITSASWFLLGIWFGMGYCPITDWQWSVKERLGERNLPGNFVEYFAEKLSGRDFDPGFVDLLTGICFLLAAIASVYANFFKKR
ncbi:MAG: DUF2784 domain-containing protein [Chitinophagaceae bacterium]|nr:DUF2784 domain-containing protein [Chitinophagaceae bacterium]